MRHRRSPRGGENRRGPAGARDDARLDACVMASIARWVMVRKTARRQDGKTARNGLQGAVSRLCGVVGVCRDSSPACSECHLFESQLAEWHPTFASQHAG
jgi:hypothetical protein